MARPNLGSKRACRSCSAKFYDLGKDPAVCPECGAAHPQADFRKPRRARQPAPRAAPKKPLPQAEAESDINLDDEEEDEEDAIAMDDDTAALGDVVTPGAKQEAEDDA